MEIHFELLTFMKEVSQHEHLAFLLEYCAASSAAKQAFINRII